MKKTILLLLAVILLCVGVLSGCGNMSAAKQKYVKLSLEQGDIIIELYPEVAPESVKHFLSCVKSGYYDGKVFHRNAGVLIQGGSSDGFGSGGADETVEGEFEANGYENNLKHERGVVSLARTDDPDSASGQFFIMTQAVPALDGNYAAFGKVVEGMDVVDKIAAMPTRGLTLEDLIVKPVINKAEVLKKYTPPTE